MSRKLKCMSALNALGWIVVVPLLVAALVDPFVSFEKWPQSLLEGRDGGGVRLAQTPATGPRPGSGPAGSRVVDVTTSPSGLQASAASVTGATVVTDGGSPAGLSSDFQAATTPRDRRAPAGREAPRERIDSIPIAPDAPAPPQGGGTPVAPVAGPGVPASPPAGPVAAPAAPDPGAGPGVAVPAEPQVVEGRGVPGGGRPPAEPDLRPDAYPAEPPAVPETPEVAEEEPPAEEAPATDEEPPAQEQPPAEEAPPAEETPDGPSGPGTGPDDPGAPDPGAPAEPEPAPAVTPPVTEVTEEADVEVEGGDPPPPAP